MTLIEILVALMVTSLVIGAAAVLYSSSLAFYGVAKGTARSLPLRAAGEDELVALTRQAYFDPVLPAESDLRVIGGVRIAGISQSVVAYNLVRNYRAPLEPTTDWSITEKAAGEPMTGIVFLLQRDPIGSDPNDVAPDDPLAPAQRFLDSRLLRLEIRQADSATFGLPAASFTTVPAPALSAFLSRPEVWRAAATVFDSVYQVRFDDTGGGLAVAVKLYHRKL